MLTRYITSALLHGLNTRPAVGLLGARQVGKTTLAQHIAASRPSLYLDLESPEDASKLTDPLQLFRQHDDKLIILDEIQRLPEIFATLRGVIDERRQHKKNTGQFLLLGSASMDVLRQSSESLAGRITYIEMHGLNILEAGGSQDIIQKLWSRGGFPENFLFQNRSDSLDWREDVIRTYLERDIPAFGFKMPSTTLRRLWTMLGHLQGETPNQSTLANNLATNRTNISHYLGVLEDLFLIRKIEPYFANVKKRLVKSPRYYIRDSGLLHRLLNIYDYQALLSHPILGKSWEGFVIENIFSVLPRLCDVYFYRTSAGAEVDLVIITPKGNTWAVEIKFGVSPKITKGFHQAATDIGADKKFVIYGGDDEYPYAHATTVISLEKFLHRLITMEPDHDT